MNDFGPMRHVRAWRRPDGSRRSGCHLVETAGSLGQARPQAGRPMWPGRPSRPREPANEPEHSDMRARSSFALPRLLACYTAPDRGRSCKPARSRLTELFRAADPGCASMSIPADVPVLAPNPTFTSIWAIIACCGRAGQVGVSQRSRACPAGGRKHQAAARRGRQDDRGTAVRREPVVPVRVS
jgi:hypothetical protein